MPRLQPQRRLPSSTGPDTSSNGNPSTYCGTRCRRSSAGCPVRDAPAVTNGRVVASPRAKKLASQMGVDLSTVRGSGPHGRIQAEDVEQARRSADLCPQGCRGNRPRCFHAQPPAAAAPSAPAGNSFGRPGDTVAFNTLQGAVNRNMEASLAVPCFRVGYTITTDKLDAFSKLVKPKGVTMTALLAKAVAVTLARHPQVNAATTAAGMTYPSDVNVAIAVAMEDGGLITPVLRNADRTDLYEMSRQWKDLVKRSRSKQLQPEEIPQARSRSPTSACSVWIASTRSCPQAPAQSWRWRPPPHCGCRQGWFDCREAADAGESHR